MDDSRHDNDENINKKNSKVIIICSAVLVVILVLLISGFIFYKHNNAEGQIDSFVQAVNKNKYEKVASILSNKEDKISKSQAKYFVEYVKKDKNRNKFNKDVKHIKKNIKSNDQYDTDLGLFHDSKNRKLIEVKKNGKKLFFIDKLEFKPQLYDIYVKEYNNIGVYKYKLGESVKTASDENKLSKIGKVFVGKYKVPATKTIKHSIINGNVKGYLLIDTNKQDQSGKIIANDDFNQSWFKVDLKGKDKLNKNSLEIIIDGKKHDYKNDYVYGKVPNNSDNLTIKAKGSLDNKTFETEEGNINSNNEIQHITLSFDENEIKKHIEKNQASKDKVKKFLTSYTNDLNKAYKESDYEIISKYIEENSSTAKHMKKMVTSSQKNKYNKPTFDKIKQEKDKIKVILTKNNIKSQYVLKYNSKKDELKIISYTDI